jgi:hypothetical protein
MRKPKPLDIASWAIRMMKYRDFASEEQEEFFKEFKRTYCEAAEHLAFLTSVRSPD